MEQGRRPAYSFIVLALLLGVLFFFWIGRAVAGGKVETSILLFRQAMARGTVTEVVIEQNEEVPTGVVRFVSEKKEYYFYTSDVNRIVESFTEGEYKDSQVTWKLTDIKAGVDVLTIISIVLTIGVIAFFVIMMIRANGGGGANAQMMNFGRSRAVAVRGNKIRFKDVAGLQEEKEELVEVVEFLKDPEKFVKLGARIPKGLLLVGAPGTGKTLLAKAVAGEAGVPFFTISGSDFVEMFVGVGASRVRDLFQEAKKNSPCIVFIDEIDAVARRRGSGMGGGHDEREQTLNQLLVEMDGFAVNSGIIVLAATNRVDILDPAILRPGRFDRKITVGRPDVAGREEILKVHVRNKPLSDDVDLKRLAQTTAGFTGADLENLMNEAAIMAAKEDRPCITEKDVEQAFLKVGVGSEKKSRVISEKEKRITAYHEAGHAILLHVLPGVGPVHTISVIPTGTGAAGYTMPLPDKDEMYVTRGTLLQNIMVDLGGRIAEELVFGDVTTGASQDIKDATEYARSMVMKYGMSEEAGLINYAGSEEVFIGRDFGHTREYGESTAAILDGEVRRIVSECYGKARTIIEEHRPVLDAVAQALVEREKLDQQAFEQIFDQYAAKPEKEPEDN